ncbi:hypothetical protein D9M68_674220 [compost metagenome]
MRIEARALSEMQRFGQSLDEAGDADLVDHLGQLTATGRPHQAHHAGVSLDHRFGTRIHIRLAAHHHRQRTILRAGLTAGYRRIEKTQLQLVGPGRQLAGDIGRGRGVIDQYGSRRHAGKGAVIAQHHAAQVMVIAHANHHQLGTLGRLARGGRTAAGKFGQPLRRLGRRAVIDTHLMPAARQMPRHRITHYAQPDKGYLRHTHLRIQGYSA